MVRSYNVWMDDGMQGEENQIICYTDGSCDNSKTRENARQGGVGIVVLFNDEYYEISRGKWMNTSSARMEITAVILCLELIEPGEEMISIYTDYEMLVKTINLGWLFRWLRTGKIFANDDLWMRFLRAYEKHGKSQGVTLIWTKGHDGQKYNERAHVLANQGRKNKTIEDEGVE